MTAPPRSSDPPGDAAPGPVTDPAAFAALLRAQREAARRQRPLRSEYLQRMAEEAEQRSASTRALTVGAVALLVGLAVTITTYGAASPDGGGTGGVYVIAWGPVVFGLVQVIRGLAGRP